MKHLIINGIATFAIFFGSFFILSDEVNALQQNSCCAGNGACCDCRGACGANASSCWCNY